MSVSDTQSIDAEPRSPAVAKAGARESESAITPGSNGEVVAARQLFRERCKGAIFCDRVGGRLGDPPPIRDVGLLGSAAARPQATAFGRDAYLDVVTKAAALLQSIVNDHALVDGNERLGWLATAVFLELDGFSPSEISDDDVVEFVIWVASTSPSLDDVTDRLSRLLARRRRR